MLLTASAAAICTLFAFTLPVSTRDHVLLLLFPDEMRPKAAFPARLPAATPMARDTNPPLKERFGDFLNNKPNTIDLRDPKAVEQQVEYDAATNRYIVTEKIGDEYYRAPTYMTFEEYVKWRDRKQQQEYFDRLQGVVTPGRKRASGGVDPIAKFDIKNSLIDRLFGGTQVDIRPQGNINLTFGYQYQKTENPVLALAQQRQGIFDFDMDINMSASGKIGEKLNLNFNYNTQATFDIDNQMKLNYDTKNFSEDEIVQSVEAGNVSMPLRTNLIKGVQNLFGFKTELKFGHLRTTLLASQQRSRQQNMNVQGGSQIQTFERAADEYDENRHFFISHWNRAQFEPTLKCLPVPQSLFKITRAEVWVTNDRGRTENFREIVALADLAESDTVHMINNQFALPFLGPNLQDIKGNGLPDNNSNSLYPRLLDDLGDTTIYKDLRRADRVIRLLNGGYGLKQIRDFEKQRCVLLSPTEYTISDDLGFVSLNLNVQPDQIVGVALEYTYNGQPHKIGEFTSDVPQGDTLNQNVLFVKMLKSTTANVRYPIWDLMMKNVYSIGATNVDPTEFRFDIFYDDPGKGNKRFLNAPEIPQGLRSFPLLQLFNLDNLNLQNDPGADGIFDFVPGLTINLRTGRVMFPVLEPFGKHLGDALKTTGADSSVIKKYTYPQLYDSTLFRAREFQEFNRFRLMGRYKGSQGNNGSEIALNTFNMPPGSVRVTAGGRLLAEGVDYTVDYTTGRVKILNDAITQSGQSVNVSFEDNSLFGFQNRTMLGARFDYDFSKDVRVGATFMNLFERPLTQKVNFGEDPINNKIYGFDFNYSKEAPFLTKLVDKLPLISTKEPSSITAQAEIALLDPGYNKAINQSLKGENGIVYVDDFEGSTANLRIDFPANQWMLSSVPQGDELLFPESRFTDTILEGSNRARIAWYIQEPIVRNGDDESRPYTRIFNQRDLFPNRDLAPTEQSNLRGFDITLYPRERGPYNFEIPGGYSGISEGLTDLGELRNPKTRWGGIMKGINTQNDFEAGNIEFIEFWVLNPYMDPKDGNAVSEGGDLYFDLGSISEDILRDSRQFFENAVPTGPGTGSTAKTGWGRVPVILPIVNAFDNDPEKRKKQDLGLDGMSNDGEKAFYNKWLDQLRSSSVSKNVVAEIEQDPSNDDFVFFGDSRFNDQTPLMERYRRFNAPEGNSPTNNNDQQANGGFLTSFATNRPDQEDLNNDNSLNETESFYRYRIPLKKVQDGSGASELDITAPVLRDLITDTKVVTKGGVDHIWYRFKVPLDMPTRQAIGGISDFRSIRFLRVMMKGFTERTTLRFATLELGRNQWRRYKPELNTNKQCTDVTSSQASFDINAVTIEENAAREPFKYTIPFGIQRENVIGAFPNIRQNEQALSLTVCELGPCLGKAIFKPINMDMRLYERLKMFVHAEGRNASRANLQPNDTRLFMRIGSDFVNNYYEYEIPLVPSNENSPALLSDPDAEIYKKEIWRPENDIDLELSMFTEIKERRNAQPNFDPIKPFEIPDPNRAGAVFRIIGNPNLGYVRGAMVGVRNVDTIDRQAHCVEVWINELRLTGLSNRGGFASQARLDLKLADLGNVSSAFGYSSSGWRAIDQRLGQTQLTEVLQYDISTNVELHKFLPEKWGVRIPFYAQYSNITKTPEYDPYDLDLKLKDKLRNETNRTARDSIRSAAEDVTINRGYNFTNVRKERRGGAKKPMPWDISNFSLTYAYNQQKRRDPFIMNAEQNQYKGGLDYQYATGMKPITPFKKLIKKDKYLKFLSEFNFNPLPNTYGFNTNMERLQSVTTYRFVGEGTDPALNTFYNRRLTWDRNYDLSWDITRALKFNFDAAARSIVDEPLEFQNGRRVTAQERKDSIFTNLRNLGRPKNYTHTAALNYTLPFKYIPLMDWVNVKASYTAGYTWSAQSLKLQYMDVSGVEDRLNARNLGHVIQNNSVRQINGDLDFTKLYDKSKYLAKINKPMQKGSKGKKPAGNNPQSRMEMEEEGAGPGGRTLPGSRDKATAAKDRKAKDKKDKALTDGGVPGGAPDSTGVAAGKGKGKDKAKDKDKDKDKKKKERQPGMAERIALRPLMLVRKGRFTYSENYGTIIPGFTPETKLMGLSEGFTAPGWEFVAGLQPDRNWLDEAGAKGWITERPELNQQVTRNYTQNMDASVTVEPFRDFRIEVTANRQYTRNNTQLFKDQNFNLNPTEVNFEHRAERDLGSFTVSYFAMNTLFRKDIDGLFNRMESYGPILSERLAKIAGDERLHETAADSAAGYRRGYGRIHQEVLLPSFIAAYTDKDPRAVSLDVFKTLPSLNWKLNYNGLSKVGNLDEIFASVQIQHGYKSTMTVNSFNTDLFYNPSQPYTVDELNSNYIARFEIPQVVITEQMQPLLGVDMKLKNDMSFRLDFKKSRTLQMSFINYQLTETNSTGYTAGFGYRIKNVNIPFLTGKKAKKATAKAKAKAKKLKPGSAPIPGAPTGAGTQANDLNFKFDFDYRDDITVNHSLNQQDVSQPTRGATTISINPQAEYALNKRLKLRLFADYRKTIPKTSQSFPITTFNGGLTIQFSLN